MRDYRARPPHPDAGRWRRGRVRPAGLAGPVAGDLRVVLGSLQNVADAERMGGLALHVAEIARRRHPARTLPEESMTTSPKWSESQLISVTAPKMWSSPAIRGKPHRSAATTTPWTNCTGTSSPC